MKRVVIEPNEPFNGLPFLVAREKGFFAQEGIEIEVAQGHHARTGARTDIQDWNQVASNRGHAYHLDQGQADLYWGCEWGNYRRAQDTTCGGRQIGRRAIITCGAVIVPPWSDVYTPQQLANRLIGVPFHAGTHYLTLQMLEGFLPRELIKVCDINGDAGMRYRSLLQGDVEACSVVEPFIAVAEKHGCRVICQSFYHGTDVATEAVDAETYAAINRAVSRAVKLLNADKRWAAQLFIDFHNDDPLVAALTPDDFNLSRLVFVDPAPIPGEELQRTYDWMVSWNLINPGQSFQDLVHTDTMRGAFPVPVSPDN
ncbi:MAG: ABC transporter substrate-binding protein [Chloroflexi bacterium]|nr:ABC transporter substrate-binding protein [Chloroflexota bacterium]